MIGKLTGKIDSIFHDHLILNVMGVGYLVFCSGKTIVAMDDIKGDVALLVETHVREDHIHLYGFLYQEEKLCFNMLQSVKGVGTKMALNILSQLTPANIQQALSAGDMSVFHNVVGVGKKLAERIITELKDKTVVTNMTVNISANNIATTKEDRILDDAVSALMNLGVNKADALTRVNAIASKQGGISLSELIRLALKQ